MLKIMLADIDGDNVKNFRTYIKLAFPDMKVVGNAVAGSDFVGQVKDVDPDLIIADIHFFGVNALKILRDTYEFFPDKRFILYGTYNDAEYMEKAVEYGVVGHIFRPVKPADLERSLQRALKIFVDMRRIEAEQRKLSSQYKGKIDMFRDRFLVNLTGGHLTDRSEILSSFDYFDIALSPGYSVFTVRIDHFKKIILTLDEMGKHLLVYKILLTINENLKRIDNGVPVVNRLNTISVVLGGDMPLFDTIEFCDSLRLDILHQTKIHTTIGLGRVYDDPRDIAVSYGESESALRYRHYVGYGTVIPIHFVEPLNNITYRYPLEKEERLVYSAVTGDFVRCKELLGQIIATLRACEPLPDKLLPKIIMDILFSINRFASEQHMEIDRFASFFPTKEVIALTTLDDAHAFLEKALKSFCAHILEIKDVYNNNLIDKVKAYIEENYQQNVSLAILAAHAGTTPEFLANLFQKNKLGSVYQYAISVRIAKAAAMMREHNHSVDEVAKAVGYEDIKYFNAVFKQREGITADEFRRRVR